MTVSLQQHLTEPFLPYAGLPPTVPQYAKITLTQNSIENLITTPIEIVPAPGDGYAIVPVSAYAIFHGQGKAGYSNAGSFGGYLKVTLGDDSLSSNWLATGSIMQIAEESIIIFFVGIGIHGIDGYLSTSSNAPLLLTQNGSDELSGGNATMDVIINYLIIPVK